MISKQKIRYSKIDKDKPLLDPSYFSYQNDGFVWYTEAMSILIFERTMNIWFLEQSEAKRKNFKIKRLKSLIYKKKVVAL